MQQPLPIDEPPTPDIVVLEPVAESTPDPLPGDEEQEEENGD